MSVELNGNIIDETLYTTGTVDSETETLNSSFVPSIYKERMIGSYPKVIQDILEFKAIINAEYSEFEAQRIGRDHLIQDAYLSTMAEDRIKEWEQVFGITPIEGSTLSDRRETIIARIKGQGKLNTALINNIVHTFTGGSANSWIKNSTLYVEITPPPGNKQYQFDNVKQELSKKVPAHLNFKVSRNYYEWSQVKTTFATWQDVKNAGTWEDIYLFVPFTR